MIQRKIGLIKSLGTQVPFWDQWDAEAAFLYKALSD
jgi:hypothetical protein